MSRFKDRPILSWPALGALGPKARYSHRALLNCGEFLKTAKALSGHFLSRRTLQFYSSPEIRLMPLPRHTRGHTSHYLHPEDTLRLAVVLHLRGRYFFPIKLLREVLATLSPDHYGLVLKDCLTPEDIQRLARSEGSEITPEGLILQRVSRLLSAAEGCARSAPIDAAFLGSLSRFQEMASAKC